MIQKQSSSQSQQQKQESLNFAKLNPAQKKEPEPQQFSKSLTIPTIIPEPKKLNITTKATPRLIIDRIILNNFKSYAGKQIIGPFHHNFTSVVGPNGSGKSNLIESLLFVFGFRASWMRLNKLNQLIHKSAKMMDISSAYVQVHFKQILDGQDGQIISIPNTEFTIQRNVNQSGTSKYLYNKHQVRSEDIKQKLEEKGISLTNHRFLILQGQVQQITHMKQKSGDQNNPGLLEYLEEIIGSNQYLEKITNTTEQYNKIQETRHQKGERMKLVQSQLKSMTKGKDEAIKFIKLQKKVYQLRNIVLQFSYRRLNQGLKTNELKVKQCEQKKQQAIQEQKEKIQKQLQRVKELNILVKKETQCKNKKLKLQQQIKKLESDDDFLRTQCKDKQQDLNKLNERKKKFEQQFTKINQNSHEIMNVLPAKVQQLKKKMNELRELEKQLQKYGPFEYPKQYSTLKSQEKQFDFKINLLKQKRDHMIHKNKKILENLNKNFKSEEQIKKILSELEVEKQQLEIVTKKINQQIQLSQNNKRQLSQQDNKFKSEIDRIDQRLKQNRRDREQNGQKNNIFTQIMKKKIPGVLGRLGDMGKATTNNFDQIITSCCYQLDNIVVRNYEAAQKVVAFLKQSKLGKATCIILDKISEYTYNMKKQFSSPPNTVRLFDQIIPINQEAKIAFYNVLNDTLYCADGQLAKNLAYDERQRRRIVTKKKYGDGIITMEKSGIMTGSVLKRGGLTGGAQMNIETKQYEQGQLEIEKRRIRSQIEKLQQFRLKQQERLKQLNRDLNQIQEVYRENKNKSNSLIEQIQQIEKQKKKKSTYMKDSEQLTKEIRSLEQAIYKTQEQKAIVSQKVRKIQEKQKEKQGEVIQTLKKKINQKRENSKNLQKQTIKMNMIIQQTQSKIQKNQAETRQITKKIEKFIIHIEKIQKQLNSNDEKLKDLLQKINIEDQISKQLYEKRNQFESINKNDQNIISEAKRRIQIIKDQIQHYKNLVKKSREQFQKAQKQLDNSRNQYKRIISGYDFLAQLDQIQRMFTDQSKKNSQSFDQRNQISILEQSIITSHEGGRSKLFPIEILNNIQPLSDLTEQQHQTLSPFEQQLNTLLATEAVSLQKTQGNSISIIRQFKIKYVDYKQKFNEYEQVKNKLLQLKRQIDFLKQKRLSMFRQGFQIIGAKLKQVYQFLTKGGDAQLELIDSLDPFSDGINFSVRPPKKSWKQINKLSGGEKTLSSLSLIFALHYYKPTPLYFMDQIDAALDYKNVSIVANYIKKRTKNAQFIIISLRNNMFELANKLVGVYKTNDMTKTISIIPELVLKKIEMRQKENENAKN